MVESHGAWKERYIQGTNELWLDLNSAACSIFPGINTIFIYFTPGRILKFLVFHTDSSKALRSKIVQVFWGALLSILFVLVLIPKGFASSCTCIGDKCLFVVQIRLIDCSRGLESTPQPKKRIVNYTTLSLRYNLSLEVNCTLLMEQFSNLKTANIRNNPIYCERVNAFENHNRLQRMDLQHITG